MRPVHSVAPLVLILALASCKGESGAELPADTPSAAIEAMTPVTEPAAAAEAIPASGDSRMDGYGPLEFGMTAEEARAAWKGNPLEPAAPEGDPAACHHLSPAGQATQATLAFMFEDDLFVRYSVESTEITAPGGGRVGMDEASLQGLYGERLESAPHKYVEGGSMLMSPEDGGALPSRLFFELDANGRVTSWRVGVAPQIGYVEGCS
jgi:hypothetical protein